MNDSYFRKFRILKANIDLIEKSRCRFVRFFKFLQDDTCHLSVRSSDIIQYSELETRRLVPMTYILISINSDKSAVVKNDI